MSIYKREWKNKQGKPRFCWYFHRTIDGKRYRIALKTAETKTQAKDVAEKIISQIRNGTYGKPDGPNVFIEFAEKVYLPWSKENKRSTSDQYYIEVFKRFFKKKTFAEISSMLIEKFKSERRKTQTKAKKTRRSASVNREIECLSSIFSMAMRAPYRLVRENPCREVTKLKEENERNRYLTEDEEKRLLAECVGRRAHLRPILLLALNTGMRRGEILSLRWSQVDFARGLIHLVRTKSGKSRLVPINTLVRETLLELQSKASGEWVFRGAGTGKGITDVKKAFSAACQDAKIEDLHFHDLRHTAATRMAETGAEPSTIKDILGHSDLRMTDRYTHAVELRKRAALERIADYGSRIV
ncbi:MAG TPA: site-specific integrase, partial [Blastocatellia bacterium]|nr:site-specific integrase [Blastocatellia bacterium]